MGEGIVVLAAPGGVSVALPDGATATFGRIRADGGPAHLGLSASQALHASAGSVTAHPDRWLLTNTGRWLQLRVLDRTGPDRADVAPGRSLLVAWSSARIEIATGEETLHVDVACPGALSGGVAPGAGGDTVGGLGLDRSAGYFRALVALCEPRLRDPGSDQLPSAGDVARRLNGSGAEAARVSAKAVERRLAHLRQRIGVVPAAPHGGSAEGLELRDAARRLVDLALRTGTVTAADLALLDAPPER